MSITTKPVIISELLVSGCCGALERSHNDGDVYDSDLGFCPECKEHCEFVAEATYYGEEETDGTIAG